MRHATQLRSLRDIRTTISLHARSTPRQNSSAFLEAYLLGKEKERLETELALLLKRQRQIRDRLVEIRLATDELMRVADAERSETTAAGDGSAADANGRETSPRHQSRTLTIGY